MAEEPTEDRELDSWLAELAGKQTGDTTGATRLRQLILYEHRRHEAEFDEIRERRLRQRVLAVLGTADAGKRSMLRWTRPVAVAASVFVVVAAGLMVNRMLYQMGSPDDGGWVLSYGELERTRGEATVLRANVDAPANAARRLGADLAEQAVAFEMVPRDDGSYRLELYVTDAEALGRLNTVLRALSLRADAPGFYIVIIS